MRLLRRHILATLTGPFLFAWIAQTGMLMLNQLSRRFGELVGKGLPTGVIVEVLVLFIPFIVALTLPMAILVAVLYAYSQMGSDNELTAMRANGVSVMQMLRPALVAGVFLSFANFFFIDQVLPRTNLRLLNLQSDIAQKKPTFSLHEQAINNLPQSQYFLQASRIEPGSGRMKEVIIWDMTPQAGRRVVYADSGYMTFERNQQDLGILLYHGRVNEYKTAEAATLNVTRFETNIIRVRGIQNAFQQSFNAASKGDREMTTCEMMDQVASSSAQARRTMTQRDELARNDVKALLHLYGPRPGDQSPAVEAPSRRCGPWKTFEKWFGRLLLPRDIAGRDAEPPAPPPFDSVKSIRLTGTSPDTTAGRGAAAADARGIDSTPPPAAAMSSITDLTSSHEEEGFAIREVHQYSVEIHKKFALSVACMNFVLIGVALALRFPRGGIGLVIGASLVIFALFYVGLTTGENLADRGSISPALAMWLPNGIVFVVGILGLLRVNREFGSTRGGDLADLADSLLGWIRKRRA